MGFGFGEIGIVQVDAGSADAAETGLAGALFRAFRSMTSAGCRSRAALACAFQIVAAGAAVVLIAQIITRMMSHANNLSFYGENRGSVPGPVSLKRCRQGGGKLPKHRKQGSGIL